MNKLKNLLIDNYLYEGRMVGSSKSLYSRLHPGNLVAYNCNIIDCDGQKVWWGDLDLTMSDAVLQKIANELDESFLILREMDCRYGSEEKDYESFKIKAIREYIPNAKI